MTLDIGQSQKFKIKTHLLYNMSPQNKYVMHLMIYKQNNWRDTNTTHNGKYEVSMTSGDLKYKSIWKKRDTPSPYEAPIHLKLNGFN